MVETKEILLAEDDPKDVELTLVALEEHNLSNKVVVTRDGAEALDYLYRRGAYADRPAGHPLVVLTSSCQERDIVESYDLGANACADEFDKGECDGNCTPPAHFGR
jgi:DNA-binding NarL/FixJ family response regulator